jgi:type II secretion system protein G
MKYFFSRTAETKSQKDFAAEGFTPYRDCSGCTIVSPVRSKLSTTPVKPSHGFTLIELLVVISIIGLLASVVLASLNTARAKARDARRISDMKQISLALELYYDANGSYPSEVCGGQWAIHHPGYETCWVDLEVKLAPYISKLPTDPSATYPHAAPYYAYHYNSLNWYNAGYHAWLGGANQGYVIMAYLERSTTATEGDCWLDGGNKWYTRCVK